MSRYLCASIALLAMLTSCHGNNSNSNTVSSKAQSTKPKIAIAPAIDNSNGALPWNLSDEIAYSLHSLLGKKQQFLLDDPQHIKSVARRLQNSNDPFSGELDWVKRSFSKDDFVVFVEVLKHEESANLTDPSCKPQECSAHLDVVCRVVVVDIRNNTPKVILQELMQDTHFIPKQFNQYNFHQVSWGSEGFAISPMGMAHSDLFKEISSRVEEYINLAKSS